MEKLFGSTASKELVITYIQRVIDSLTECVPDPGIGFGPYHELAQQRREEVLEDSKCLLGVLKSEGPLLPSESLKKRVRDVGAGIIRTASNSEDEWLERERLLFEEWMRGHCWAITAKWSPERHQYLGDTEIESGEVDFRAMRMRELFAAFRDRSIIAEGE